MIETPVDSRRTKLATTVADRLIEDIDRAGLPVGTVFGSETDLLARYGVSRAVLREAIRLVEHQRVASMRRGPGGGLVVDEPDLDAVLSAAVLYLARADARLDEVFDARLVLEGLVAELACGRLEEADIEALRAHVRDEQAGTAVDHRRLHTLLAGATKNPALDLFVECLNRMATYYVLDRGELTVAALADSVHAHDRIATAIIAHQPDVARSRMQRHLQAEADYMRTRLPADQRLQHSAALDATLGAKRAEAVAAAIFADVMATAAEPGTFLGSEADLMARHDASRAVFREAVRILEHHHVALMKRGPHGGLIVAAPDAAAVATIVAIHLQRRGVTAEQLREVRIGVELALVASVGTSVGPTAASRLRAFVEAGPDEGGDLHALLASLSGNRALELVAYVLQRLSGRPPADQRPAQVAIAEALIAGDNPLALHRMRQFLSTPMN